MMLRIAALAVVLALSACSDSSTEGCPVWDAASYAVPNPSGKLHGQVCSQNSDCSHNLCYKSKAITGGEVGICTKDCSSCPQNDCSLDGDGFSCARFSPYDENPESFCVRNCTTDADCDAPLKCVLGTGTAHKVCRKAG